VISPGASIIASQIYCIGQTLTKQERKIKEIYFMIFSSS